MLKYFTTLYKTCKLIIVIECDNSYSSIQDFMTVQRGNVETIYKEVTLEFLLEEYRVGVGCAGKGKRCFTQG